MTEAIDRAKADFTTRQRSIYNSAVRAIHRLQENAGPFDRDIGTQVKPVKRDRILRQIRSMATAQEPGWITPAEFNDMGDRDMRRAISAGRKAGSWPCILSSTNGYYLAQSAEEIEEAAEYLNSYLVDEARNLAGLRASAAYARGLPMFPEYTDQARTSPSPWQPNVQQTSTEKQEQQQCLDNSAEKRPADVQREPSIDQEEQEDEPDWCRDCTMRICAGCEHQTFFSLPHE